MLFQAVLIRYPSNASNGRAVYPAGVSGQFPDSIHPLCMAHALSLNGLTTPSRPCKFLVWPLYVFRPEAGVFAFSVK
jgi:hypothetical protein